MDELSQYLLERYPDNYITGDDDCNLLIWSTEEDVNRTPKMCSFMIGLEYDPYSLPEMQIRGVLDRDIRNNSARKKLLGYGSKFAENMRLPFMMIVYPAMRKEFDGRWEDSKSKYDPEQVNFYCAESLNSFAGRIVSGAGLRELIYHHLGGNYSDAGTTKEKNKKLADYFHLWSRDSLTRHIVKFDLDGFIFSAESGKTALVEFKRSTQAPWIPEWYPTYDKPDYILQYTFAQKIGAGFWLLHHEKRAPLEEGYVSFFDIDGIDRSEPEYFLHFRRRAMKIPLHGEGGLDHIIRQFIASPDADVHQSLCCPLCGSLIRRGQYGYYCSGKASGMCSMNVGKHYNYELEKEQLRSLLKGIPVSYVFNGKKTALSPKVELHTYLEKTSCRWKKVRRHP